MGEDNKNVLIEKVDFSFEIFPDKEQNNTSKKVKKEYMTYEGSNKVVLKKRLYIGFKTRITILIVSIITLLLISLVSFLLIFHASKHYEIRLSESSNINYRVCGNSYTCKKSKRFKIDNASYLDTDFIYNVDISDLLEYNIDYYIVGDFSIKDKSDDDIVLFRKKDYLVKEKNIKKISDNIHIDERINIELEDYYDKVKDYIIKNNVEVDSNLVVSLFVKDDKGVKEKTSISFNLTDKRIKPRVKNITKKDKSIIVEKDAWTDTNIILVLICAGCGVVVLLLIIRLSNLLLKAFYRKDRYTKEIKKILRTYDDDIVVARNGFVSLENKRVVKVSDFKELLDAKNILKKPIVYVKINDIKSKFIVEDVECIYEYTVKDLDF